MLDSISLIISEGKGGLFDLGATIGLVVVQVLALMAILDVILFNPVLKVMDDREQLISDDLDIAGWYNWYTGVIKETYDRDTNQSWEQEKERMDIFRKSVYEFVNNELELLSAACEKQLEKDLVNLRSDYDEASVTCSSEIISLSELILKKLTSSSTLSKT